VASHPSRNFNIPGTLIPVQILSWKYEEITPAEACDLLTRTLRWQDARARFPGHFSPDRACEALIEAGKEKEAHKNFPDQYQGVMSGVRGAER
jgi:hypothetical protein